MKKYICTIILFLADIFAIFVCLALAVWFKSVFDYFFDLKSDYNLIKYISFYHIYIILALIFIYQGIYTTRFDFWHENFIILKSLILGFVIIFSILGLSKNLSFSRLIITFAFIFMAFLIPIFKFFLKPMLYKIGLFAKRAYIINADKNFRAEIFKNHYLGYKLSPKKHYDTIFISSQNLHPNELENSIQENIFTHKEIIFTPMTCDYDMSKAISFSLFNSQTNLTILQNSLLSPLNRGLKVLFDLILVLLALPVLILAFFVIFVLIKLEEPLGSVFFKQKRLGQNGKEFWCYKFRSMREDGDKILKEYLAKNPQEVEFYEKFHKYENDPRITKIGNFLRKSSLDELPQLINVLKLEMSIVGPRPFITDERKNAGVSSIDHSILLAVKPGLTGLAQVLGRGSTDFKIRTQMDIWYVKNWSIYFDLVIIFKTIIAVLKQDGAS